MLADIKAGPRSTFVFCMVCGHRRRVFNRDLRKGAGKCCTRKCKALLMSSAIRGAHPGNWKGRPVFIDGRPCTYRPGHHRAMSNGYVYDHIVIAETALGRPLLYIGTAHPDNEVVHHVNQDRKDNSPSNLLICTNTYHKWLHGKMNGGLNVSRHPASHRG